MLQVYTYGSDEIGQLGLPDFEGGESRNIRKVTISQEPSIKVYKICCGSMHTLVLTTLGKIFSWGCNDIGALGREGDEKTPTEVILEHPMNNIAAGDSVSLAYNTELNMVYQWGAFRVKKSCYFLFYNFF